MPFWDILLDILILLGSALALGTLAEVVRQSALLGYLVAGMVVGPNVLGLVGQADHVRAIAELGVAMLLFAIGLEFSFSRLRRLWRVAALGGGLQVVGTLGVAALVAWALGVAPAGAVAIGAMVSLSSTACVLRLLVDRAAVDSLHGRNALGVLLLQDLAVIPLLLTVVALTSGTSALQATLLIGRTVLVAGVLVAAYVVVIRLLVPRLLNLEQWSRNRELPILFALVLALGSAHAAHAASLSPAIGAFVGGVLLGQSPFAPQLRADIASLRTLLVTLFFASLGMLGDPSWAAAHWHLVLGTVALVIAGKSLVTFGAMRLIGIPTGIAAATALCLAQIGEFSFVLAETARGGSPIIGEHLFRLVVSATIATVFVTPLLVALAPRVATLVERRGRGRRLEAEGDEPPSDERERDIVIIGFGPAGQAVASALHARHAQRMIVLELNARTAAAARGFGLPVHLGDATHPEVLEHAGIAGARVVVITLPDASAARSIINLCRQLAPQADVISRSRYHVHRWELVMAGAREVVDEEEQVGRRLAAAARRSLGTHRADS